jgi:hypothetical protein
MSFIFHRGWGFELHHRSDFVHVWFNACGCDPVAEESELTQAELTFLELQRQTSSSQSVQYFL